jgi:tRNA nucleotidyltransferase (CCA-adding enzyme)
MPSINSIFQEVLKTIKPSEKELGEINKLSKEFLKKFQEKLKKSKIDAEIFIGGSFAKKTVIKKDHYDIDVFVQYNKKYEDSKISGLTKKILESLGKFETVHGSRDYFRISINSQAFIELIPVKKIKSPKEAENTTDLSYLHVKYINKKIKSDKILDEIRLAKAFCHANKFYGAESYIGGFSGYSLELLIIYYKSFTNFIKAIAKLKEKTVVDIEKHYKDKQRVMMDLNSSKLSSPIILIDPTFKYRNALAALREETFKKFQEACRDFIKNPSTKWFSEKKIDLEKIKEDAKKKNYEFVLLEASTNKQAGDVAGSKLLKFYNYLSLELSKFYEIKNKGFDYKQSNNSKFFFVTKNKEEITINGPSLDDKKNVLNFKKKHKNTFIKKNRIFAKEKTNEKLASFIDKWKSKNIRRIKEMYITGLKRIN